MSFALILSPKKLLISFLVWLDVDILSCIVENNGVYNNTAGDVPVLLTAT
jgi:hypothetical protein